MVQAVLPTQVSNTLVSRASGGHTPTRPSGGRSGLTSNRGILPAGTVSALSALPGLRNNSSALLNTVRSLASLKGHADSVNDVVSHLNDSTSGRSTSGRSTSGSSTPSRILVDSPSQPETFDYLDAPWASAYKMSRETAYSEALNNTSYQRAVKDMMRAGLNPAVIFGAGNGYTAGVPAYVSSGSSASASASVRSVRSGSGSGRSNSSDKLFSSSAYSVMSALGGIVGALATKSAGGYWIGTSLTQGAMSALSLLSKASKKR